MKPEGDTEQSKDVVFSTYANFVMKPYKPRKKQDKSHEQTKCGNVLNNDDHLFACDICDKTYFYKRGLKNHIRTKHLNIHYHSCDLCPYTCNAQDRMHAHIVKHHGGAPLFHCPKCWKALASKHSVVAHLQSCGKKPSIGCNLCVKRFRTERNLAIHLHRVHGQVKLK